MWGISWKFKKGNTFGVKGEIGKVYKNYGPNKNYRPLNFIVNQKVQ